MTSAIANSPRFKFFTNTGAPAADCLLYTYGAGSLVQKTTWQDQGQTTANTNPIVLDANGECLLWLEAGQEYKFVLKTAGGTVLNTTDDIAGSDILLREDLSRYSGAFLVGFIQPETGSVPRTVQDKMRDLKMRTEYDTEANYKAAALALSTGGYWMDQSPTPRHWRFSDRAFFGDAAAQANGDKIQGTDAGTWLTSQNNAFWIERDAEVLSVNPWGGFGGVFASRASDKSKAGYYGDATIGIIGVAENDDVGHSIIGWAGYLEANRGAGNGSVYGCEFSVKNKGNDVTSHPYNPNGWGSIGAWFPAGGDSSYNGSPTNPNNTAIMIGSGVGAGPKSWNRGIVFNSTGITGTDGVTGTGIAIDMAKGHVMRWAISTGANGAVIYSNVSTAGKDVGITFNNDNIVLSGQSASPILSLNQNTGVTSSNADYISLYNNVGTGGGTGQVDIYAAGLSTDIHMSFHPKGSGKMRFGTFTGSADVPITGSISILDSAGNLRKLAVIA